MLKTYLSGLQARSQLSAAFDFRYLGVTQILERPSRYQTNTVTTTVFLVSNVSRYCFNRIWITDPTLYKKKKKVSLNLRPCASTGRYHPIYLSIMDGVWPRRTRLSGGNHSNFHRCKVVPNRCKYWYTYGFQESCFFIQNLKHDQNYKRSPLLIRHTSNYQPRGKRASWPRPPWLPSRCSS